MSTVLASVNLSDNKAQPISSWYSRITTDAQGKELSPVEVRGANDKYNQIVEAAGTGPVIWYNSLYSFGSTGTNTKTFNLGTAGAAGDGILTNGDVSTMVTADGIDFEASSNQKIATTLSTFGDVMTYFVKTRVESTTASGAFVGATGSGSMMYGYQGSTGSVRIFDASFPTITTTANVNVGTFETITLTYNYSGGAWEVFQDGVTADNNTQAATFNSTRTFEIGFGASFYMDGILDDILIFNAILTPTQIANLDTLING